MAVMTTIPFREALKEVIRKYELKAADIAKMAHVPESSLSKYLGGSSDLKSEDLDRILGVLPEKPHTHLLTLLAGSDNKLIPGVNPQDESDGRESLAMISAIQQFVRAGGNKRYLRVLEAITRGRDQALSDYSVTLEDA